ASGRPLVVAVAGSALAVSRPILRERIARGEGPTTRVYIGARTARDVALAHEVADWAASGVRVVLCLSRPEPAEADLLAASRRASGRVQSVLRSDLLEGVVGDALVFAAGPAGMLDDLRALEQVRAS